MRCSGCGRRLCRVRCFSEETKVLRCPDCVDASLEYSRPGIASNHLPNTHKVEALEYPFDCVYALRCAWSLRRASAIGDRLKNAVDLVLTYSKVCFVEEEGRAWGLRNLHLHTIVELAGVEPLKALGQSSAHTEACPHRDGGDWLLRMPRTSSA